MLIYLSKKIAIPNQKKVKSVCWSINHGFIACGAENGLLKVLKLDNSDPEHSSLNLPKNLSMNQNLVGHTGTVIIVIWNEKYQKLTSTDSNGLIIVWMLYKGAWYEEMVNNRNKSCVVGMVWSNDGLRICIVYEDGAVIVGSVDGSRLWSRDIKSVKLTSVMWSPDGKLLLFGTINKQIFCYDSSGNFIFYVPLPSNGSLGRQLNGSPKISVTCIEWLSNVDSNFKLIIAFSNGFIQLMKNECDENSILIDTKMIIVDVKWSFGSIFAVSGRCEVEDSNLVNCVKFYDSFGKFIQTLKVPGSEIVACSWEKEGFRLVVGVDCYLFFINMKPTYKWGYFASSLVIAIPSSFNLIEEVKLSPMNVVFCQLASNTKHVQSVKNLLQLSTFNQFCVFATSINDISISNGAENQIYDPKFFTTSLILCNSIGTLVDSVNINFKVEHIALNKSRVVAASKKQFAIWIFTNFNQKSSWTNISNEVTEYSSKEKQEILESTNKINLIQVSSNDFIKCICMSEKILIIGQESGTFLVYLLPEVNLLTNFVINCSPKCIKLNLNSTLLSIVDESNLLYIYELNSETNSGKLINFEKKEVWDFCWSQDNANAFAIAEKSKIILYSNFESDEAIQSSGYICEYKNLVIRTAAIDGLVAEFFFEKEESIDLKKFINKFEVKALREARQILNEKGVQEAAVFCESISHPKLWRLLAEESLSKLDLKMAETALVCCQDYKSIQFVKKLSKLPKDEMKKAEVKAYFKQFDEAEKIYLDIDRKDLVINLRKTIQDWLQVLNLLKKDNCCANDAEIKNAKIKLADYFFENHEWSQAAELYEETEVWEKFVECCIILDNFEGLKKVLKVSENISLLLELGSIFEFSNLCFEAVEAYSKANQINLAIKCCINLNEWKIAMDLAHTNKVTNIDSLLSDYASHLLSKSKFIEIVELYRKANKIYDAVGILLKMIHQIKKNTKLYSTSPLWLKKIYTLIGLLYFDLKNQYKVEEKKPALETLLDANSALEKFSDIDIKILDQPWKGAEAFHFYLMAHKQLYNGQYLKAMETSLILVDYDDYIELENIFNLIAISSFACKNFYICSKAFIKLESCENFSKEKKLIYSNLAFEIFTKFQPQKPKNLISIKCPNCDAILENWLKSCTVCNIKFTNCIASGQSILNLNLEWSCLKCKHYAIKSELIKFYNCPLCHYPIENL